MKRAIIILAFAAAGCKTSPPAVVTRTVEVPVIRVEKCIASKDIPAKPAGLTKRPKTVSAALDTAVAKILEWQTYGDKTDAVLRGCAGKEM